MNAIVNEDKDPDFYQKIFSEICSGFSSATLDNREVYIKHLSTKDHAYLNLREKDFLKRAKKRGLITRKEAIEDAIRDELWKQEDSDEMDRLEIYIENLEKTKKNLLLTSEKEEHEKLIKIEKGKLDLKKGVLETITRNTAEAYAKKQLNDLYIFSSFYIDENLQTRLYSQSEYDELSYKQITKLIVINNTYQEELSDTNIKKCVLEDFFQSYMFMCDNPMDFYGKPAMDLSSYQITLLMYSKIFKNIFENVDDIPDKLKKDPQGLLDFASSSSARKKMKDNLNKDGSTTVFGATEEDYQNMGVDDDLVKGKSLHEAAKKKGGTLNMEDLMKLS